LFHITFFPSNCTSAQQFSFALIQFGSRFSIINRSSFTYCLEDGCRVGTDRRRDLRDQNQVKVGALEMRGAGSPLAHRSSQDGCWSSVYRNITICSPIAVPGRTLQQTMHYVQRGTIMIPHHSNCRRHAFHTTKMLVVAEVTSPFKLSRQRPGKYIQQPPTTDAAAPMGLANRWMALIADTCAGRSATVGLPRGDVLPPSLGQRKNLSFLVYGWT